MLSALIPPVGRKPAVPLAEQLAHESYVRPGPLVLGTAFLRSPAAASDRDRTVSRAYSYITVGADYTFTLFRGAGVLWLPQGSAGLGSPMKPSPRCCWRGSRYRGTTLPCYVDVAHIHGDALLPLWNSLGVACACSACTVCWPSLGIAPAVPFGRTAGVSPI